MPEEIKPKFDKKRPRCPFYGFGYVHRSLIDQQGNQCAALVNKYSPCQMEISGKVIDWDICPQNNQRAKECIKLIYTCNVFPREFHPGGIWSGISFKEWYELVMEKR